LRPLTVPVATGRDPGPVVDVPASGGGPTHALAWLTASGRLARLLVPTANDWREVGLLLGQIGARLGYEAVSRGRLTNDALLALSARRFGLTVMTLNAADFALLSRFHPFMFLQIDPLAAGI
jgi:hypothetical protein